MILLTDNSDSDLIKNFFIKETEFTFLDMLPAITSSVYCNLQHEIFCKNFLGQLKSWQCFTNNTQTSAVVCYQSPDEPCLYITDILGSLDLAIFSEVVHLKLNDKIKRFSICLPIEKQNIIDLDSFLSYNECEVPIRTRCPYNRFWQILYKRQLPTKYTTVKSYIQIKK